MYIIGSDEDPLAFLPEELIIISYVNYNFLHKVDPLAFSPEDAARHVIIIPCE